MVILIILFLINILNLNLNVNASQNIQKNQINEVNDIIKGLENNSLYKELYGCLYKANNTDIDLISSSLEMYDHYKDVFESPEKIYNSFIKYSELKEIVDKVVELNDEIGENLRLYSLIFKDSVSRYYFSNIENNVDYLTKLLDAQEELNVYLSITRGIGVLNEYKLFSIIRFIEENDDINGVSSKFSLVYLDGIIKKYLDGKNYDQKEAQSWCNQISDEIIKTLHSQQRGFKFICNGTIFQKGPPS